MSGANFLSLMPLLSYTTSDKKVNLKSLDCSDKISLKANIFHQLKILKF